MERVQDLGTLMKVLLMLACCSDSLQVSDGPMDRYWEEIANVKVMMTSISGELERFNTLYLNKLETRMVAMATLLGNLDSNVKNLQERAHVWDTFQLHVAAWNEQINTLDKKVDILSRGQEKLVHMDGKVSTLVNLDYKVERLVRKMDETDNKLAVISKTLDSQHDDPLFGEFATRGILSTLKTIERKVDHIEGNLSHPHGKSGKSCGKKNESDNIEGGEESVVGKGKLVIKCNTPVIVEEILRDVASKVDVIFDKIGQEDGPETRSGDMLSDEQASMEQARPASDEGEIVEKLWKRLSAPNKRTARILESVEKSLKFVENTTSALWKDQTSMLDQILTCCTNNEQKFYSLTNNVDTSFKRIDYLLTSQDISTGVDVIAKQFNHQKTEFDGMLQKYLASCSNKSKSQPDIVTKPTVVTSSSDLSGSGDGDDDDEDHQLEKEKEDEPTHAQNNCENLVGTGSKSGVYLTKHREGSGKATLRYCEMTQDGGGWTVIQRRGDFPGPRQNFSVTWDLYKKGFGNIEQEFWIGNDILHDITTHQDYTLRIDMEDFENNKAWAEFSIFRVGPEADAYRLVVGGYTGNATDSLSLHNGSAFSTVDRKNDGAPECCPCAPAYGGGWWFRSCFEANLNGDYYTPGEDRDYFRGLIWEHWLGNSSLKKSRMMIRALELVNNESSREQDFVVPTVPTPTVPTPDVHTLDIPDVQALDIPDDP